MRLRLDTAPFLRMVGGPRRLPARVRELAADPGERGFLSAASAGEIAVKHRLGKLPLPSPPERFVPAMREAHGVIALPIGEPAAPQTARLPVGPRPKAATSWKAATS